MKFLMAALLLFTAPGFANDAQKAFEHLKTLEGTWVMDGHSEELTYEVASDGSALVEKHMGMVSVYHLDKTAIMMTHYCSAQNQPRLRATQFNQYEKTLEFDFLDVTNDNGQGYINHLKIEFIDKNTIKETWTYFVDANTGDEVFLLKRK